MTTLADELRPHLPLLRRFSRALTGSQDAGDAYVGATLQAIVTDPASLDSNLSRQAGLYKAFLKIWRSVPANQIGDPVEGRSSELVEERLKTLAPESRQAFLLVGMEGFERLTAAKIMGVEPIMLDNLITQAGQEIADQVATDVLIIEDEPLIAMDLEAIVTSLNHSVSAIARTHSEAVARTKEKMPGLVLADIQLADGSSGLEAVNELLQINNTPVIFITAFPERLLTGDRPEPAFLISKPFQPMNVRAIISQALFFDQKAGG